jgi:hypothetical protein
MILDRARLEYGFVLEGPSFGSVGQELPLRMQSENRLGVFVVRSEISAKVESRSLPCPTRHRSEKVGLHDAMFVVTELGPRIGEKNEEAREGHVRRQGLEKKPRLGMDKVEVGELGAVAFAEGAADSFAHNVDPDAELPGVGLGIGGEEMAMSAAYFPSKLGVRREDLRMPLAQIATTGCHAFKKLGGASWIFHGK